MRPWDSRFLASRLGVHHLVGGKCLHTVLCTTQDTAVQLPLIDFVYQRLRQARYCRSRIKNWYYFSILCAQAHNEGDCVTSDNVRRRSKPRRSRGVGEAQSRRSQDVAEAKRRRSRDKAETNPRRDQYCEHCRESLNVPNCVHWHIFYFM